MRRLLFILFLFPLLVFSQGNVKLLKVNGHYTSAPFPQLGNFTFLGDAMSISSTQVFYRELDSTKFDLYNVFTNGLRIGNTTVETPGTLRYNGTDVEAYKSGVGWVKLTGGVYKEELSAPKTNFSVGFTLSSNTIVLFNGVAISDATWSGEGTTTLTVSFSTDQYDNIIVKQ